VLLVARVTMTVLWPRLPSGSVKVTLPPALAVKLPAVALLIWKVQLALVLVPFTVGLAQVLLSTGLLALGVIVKLPRWCRHR
jgi:hypothetical protein